MVLITVPLVLLSVMSTSAPTPPSAVELPASSPLFEPAPLIAPPAPLLLGSGTFGYTYAELNYVYSDLDGVSGSQNGYDATLSWNLLAGLFVQGTYGNSQGSASLENYKLGAGYHIPLGDKLDIVGLISYEHDSVAVGAPSVSADGYEIDVGARFMLLEKLEVNGQLEWNHVDDDNFGVALGGRFYLIDHLSVGATVETIDQDFRFTAGARFQF